MLDEQDPGLQANYFNTQKNYNLNSNIYITNNNIFLLIF